MIAPTFAQSPEPYVRPLSMDVHVAGVVYPRVTPPEGWSPGDPLPPSEPLDGWHVDMTPAAFMAREEELAPYRVFPEQPLGEIEGHETVYLRFADAGEASGVAPDYDMSRTEAMRAIERAAAMASLTPV